MKKDFFENGSHILLLKSLNKSDLRELDNFVHSAFHNNRSEVTRFFDEIKKYHPFYDSNGFTKEGIFVKVYPNKVYREDIIRRLCSNLFKVCESYLANKAFSGDKFLNKKYVLEYYLSRFIDKLYNKQLKETLAFIEAQPARSSEYFKSITMIEEINRSFVTKSDPTAKKVNIQKELDSFITYSLISAFNLYGLAAAYARQFGQKYNTSQLEPLMKIAESTGFMHSKALEIFWLLLRFENTERNNKTFFRLKKMFESYSGLFEMEESLRIYSSMLSYCYDMKITPGKDLDKEEFEILKQMLAHGVLVTGNIIYPEWFMYIFLSAIRTGNRTFGKKFIETYKSYLPEDERSNIVNTAYAEFAIEEKDFDKALRLMALPKYHSVNEKLRLNQMYVKIYYETGQTEQFFYQADRFRQVLRNEKSLSRGLGIKVRENFVKFLVKLYKIKIGESDMPLNLLKKEINSSKILGVKWLFERIEELEKNKKIANT